MCYINIIMYRYNDVLHQLWYCYALGYLKTCNTFFLYKTLSIIILDMYHVNAGWKGDACDKPDCHNACSGQGYCNGSVGEVPVCQCVVSVVRFHLLLK